MSLGVAAVVQLGEDEGEEKEGGRRGGGKNGAE